MYYEMKTHNFNELEKIVKNNELTFIRTISQPIMSKKLW